MQSWLEPELLQDGLEEQFGAAGALSPSAFQGHYEYVSLLEIVPFAELIGLHRLEIEVTPVFGEGFVPGSEKKVPAAQSCSVLDI